MIPIDKSSFFFVVF